MGIVDKWTTCPVLELDFLVALWLLFVGSPSTKRGAERFPKVDKTIEHLSKFVLGWTGWSGGWGCVRFSNLLSEIYERMKAEWRHGWSGGYFLLSNNFLITARRHLASERRWDFVHMFAMFDGYDVINVRIREFMVFRVTSETIRSRRLENFDRWIYEVDRLSYLNLSQITARS